MNSHSKYPLVLWAQRSSSTDREKNFIYLTVKLAGLIRSTLNYSITDTTIQLKVNAKKGDIESEHAFELDFYAKVVPELLEKRATLDSVTFLIFKKDMAARYWPLLSKTALSFIKKDWSRWESVDDDDSEDIVCVSENINPIGTTDEYLKESMQLTAEALSLVQRFKRLGDPDDIKKVAVLLDDMVRLDSTEGRVDKRDNMSNVSPVEPVGEMDDIAISISIAEHTVRLTKPGHPDLPNIFNKLGMMYSLRFSRIGDVQHIDRAISYFQKSIEASPDGNADLGNRLNSLGICYSCRFERVGDPQDADCAISYFRRATEMTPDGHADLPDQFKKLGSIYSGRFSRTGDVQDIDSAILYLHKAIDVSPDGDGELPSRFNSLGIVYSCRFQSMRDIQDLEHAIFYLQKAVDLTPDGHAGLNIQLRDLGNSYSDRFEHSGDPQDIDRAISYHHKAVDLTPDDDANLPNQFTNLGISYTFRFKHIGDLQDITRAISYLHKSVELTPIGHGDLPKLFSNLGKLYSDRFESNGSLEDITRAIFYLQKAVDLTPDGHADLPNQLRSLGVCYSCRFDHAEDIQDINRAISYLHKAIKASPEDNSELPNRFNSLGNSYIKRFEFTRNLQDLDCAMSYLHKAVELTPDGNSDLRIQLGNLGISYLHYFERIGDLQHIDRAISYLHKSIELSSDGDVDLPSRLNSLGTSYMRRFNRSGDIQDNSFAISYLHKAVDMTPVGHTNIHVQLSNLGNAYSDRFGRNGDLQDINRAISNLHKAIEVTPNGHASIANHSNSLGTFYSGRFQSTGDLQDINCAIIHFHKAVELSPDGHIDLPHQFSNLGSSYLSRFERTGDLQDMKYAVSYLQKAVELTPDGHPQLPSLLCSLGTSYLHLFDLPEFLDGINHAISNFQKAIELIPDDHTDLPRVYNGLGTSLMRRFARTGDPQDVDRAILLYQKAVESTPASHISLPFGLKNLGTAFLDRFKQTRDLQDVNSAILYHKNAVESAPVGHASKPIFLYSLGASSICRFLQTNSTDHAQEGLEAFRHATKANGAPSTRLNAARLAAHYSSIHDTLHCMEDFSVAINLLSEVAGLDQTVHRRYDNIPSQSDLVGDAVAIALSYNDCQTALEWLEQGRCLVWNQLTQLRTPVDDLCLKHPSLGERFMRVARDLEHHGTRPSLSFTAKKTVSALQRKLQDETLQHTIVASEYKILLDEIRALPDFHDFLRPPKSDKLLSSLPPDGPVVIFNLSTTRCDALALRAGFKEPLHIPLEKFNLDQAQKLQKLLHVDILHARDIDDEERASRRHYNRTQADMSFVLRELWYNVIQPVLKALGCLEVPILSHRTRIWWCPTGPLAFLPLHAAGIYEETHTPGTCISDYVVSSYTPTVRSINEKFSTSSLMERASKLLIISQPNTPGLLAIPSTKTETEILAGLMKEANVSVSLLDGCEATTEAVKAEMTSCNWTHFACHGLQDANEPLESGLCLHNGSLTLLEMMKQQITNPGLAFLSACQTSKGNSNLSEEVVHLAAGMLAAGYRGVVGTMWGISDTYGPEFATEFYQYLIREQGSGGISSDKAAYALDYATRRVREQLGKGDTPFKTWVPYVHYGY